MGGVRTPILGRPRPLPRDRRASPHYTLNCEEPLYLEPIVYLSSKERFTLPQALTQYVDAYGGPMWNVQLAATALTVVPVLLVFLAAQKQFVQGLAQSGLKG